MSELTELGVVMGGVILLILIIVISAKSTLSNLGYLLAIVLFLVISTSFALKKEMSQ